jgi:hypothetical protein
MLLSLAASTGGKAETVEMRKRTPLHLSPVLRMAAKTIKLISIMVIPCEKSRKNQIDY